MHIEQNRTGAADEKMALILQEEKATTQAEKDIIHLKMMILDIAPYSRYWRWGYIGSLRRAIKAMEKQEPHIVTKTDFKNADTCGFLPAWCEERDKEHVYCECITKGALSEKRMRYWTAKPTDEQRKAAKWDDGGND